MQRDPASKKEGRKEKERKKETNKVVFILITSGKQENNNIGRSKCHFCNFIVLAMNMEILKHAQLGSSAPWAWVVRA